MNFWRDKDRNCILLGRNPNQPADCRPPKKYTGSKGFRKIGLSKCKGGENLEGTMERDCDDFSNVDTGEVFQSVLFIEKKMRDYFYFNESRALLFLDASLTVRTSIDNGAKWNPHLEGSIDYLYNDPFHTRVFLIDRTTTTLRYYYKDVEKFVTLT